MSPSLRIRRFPAHRSVRLFPGAGLARGVVRTLVLGGVLLGGSGGAAAQQAGTQHAAQPAPADTFADAGARMLLARARQRRSGVNDSITHYSAVAKERISAGVKALRRDRLVYRRETVSRIDWRRDGPGTVEVLGAREVVPIALKGVRLPDDLDSGFGHLVYDPASETLLVGLSGNDVVRHPFAPGAEADYRYASGDTTLIRLPDGRTIRLLELRVIPRRQDFLLVSGSFWLDARTFDVVRAVYRPARAFDMERDLKRVDPGEDPDEDLKDVPGILKPIVADVRAVAVDFGLWDLKWWLPRAITVEAEASAGRLLHFPVTYERTYSRYEVSAAPGDAVDPSLVAYVQAAEDSAHAAQAQRDSIRADSLRALGADTAVIGAAAAARADSTEWGDLTDAGWKNGGGCEHRPGLVCSCEDGECTYLRVVVDRDSQALVTAPELPASIYESGEVLLGREEAREISDIVADLPGAPWRPLPPRLAWGPNAPGLLRYNRIEGLSVGARLGEDLGRAEAELTLRLGFGDFEPDAELTLRPRTPKGAYAVTAYRRLSVAQDAVRAFGIGNSAQALFLGTDDGEYFRAAGLEATGEPFRKAEVGTRWRLFAEHEWSAGVGTEFSLRHLADASREFRPNIAAVDADLVGAEVDVNWDRGLDAAGARWGAGLGLESAAGRIDGAGGRAYLRPSLRLYSTIPVGSRLLVAAEAEAGASVGDVPPQRLWFLGGATTLRGYPGAVASGTSFWRGRLELANDFPAARLAVFSDAGWAGPRADFGTGQPLLSVGVGGSFLDGLVRVDLARALRGGYGWGLELYVDGIL